MSDESSFESLESGTASTDSESEPAPARPMDDGDDNTFEAHCCGERRRVHQRWVVHGVLAIACACVSIGGLLDRILRGTADATCVPFIAAWFAIFEAPLVDLLGGALAGMWLQTLPCAVAAKCVAASFREDAEGVSSLRSTGTVMAIWVCCVGLNALLAILIVMLVAA